MSAREEGRHRHRRGQGIRRRASPRPCAREGARVAALDLDGTGAKPWPSALRDREADALALAPAT